VHDSRCTSLYVFDRYVVNHHRPALGSRPCARDEHLDGGWAGLETPTLDKRAIRRADELARRQGTAHYRRAMTPESLAGRAAEKASGLFVAADDDTEGVNDESRVRDRFDRDDIDTRREPKLSHD
jgi:hypothetical protein